MHVHIHYDCIRVCIPGFILECIYLGIVFTNKHVWVFIFCFHYIASYVHIEKQKTNKQTNKKTEKKMENKNSHNLFQSFFSHNSTDLAVRVWLNHKISCFYHLHQFPKLFSSQLFSFSHVLCCTSSLSFKYLLFSKNCIMDIVPGKLNDNRLRFTSGVSCSKLMGSIYVIDWYFFFHFVYKDFYNNFVSIFFLIFFHTMDKKTVSSRILFIKIRTPTHCFYLLRKVFTCFTSKICFFFSFLSGSISSLMKFMDSLTSSMCLAPLIWASFIEEESSKILFAFFSKFCKQLLKYQHKVGILYLLRKYLCRIY